MFRTTEDVLTVGAAGIVAAAATMGGAFFPGPRLATGALLALVVWWFGFRWKGPSLAPEEWACLACVVWGCVSAAVVGMSPLVAREILAGWLIAWCLWIMARRASRKAASTAALVVIAAAVLVALGVGLESMGRGEIRVGGLFENPNVAAAVVVASLPLVGLFWEPIRRRWFSVIAIMLVGGVVLTGSRAGLLAILAAGTVLLPRGRARVVGLLAGGASITAVLVWRFVSHPEILAWFRPSIWLAVLRLSSSHPIFGVGAGGLVDAAGPVRLLHADHVGQHQFLITYAESSPLGLLVQTGAVGLVMAIVGIGLWLRHLRDSGELRFPPLQAALIGMSVMAAFHDFVNIEIVLWWWALVLGLIEASRRTESRAGHHATEPFWTRTVRGSVLALIIMWGVVQPSWARWLWRSRPIDEALVERVMDAEPWFDEPLEWRVRSLLNQNAWTWQTAAEALARGREAVRIHPGASRLWLILGQVQYRNVTELGPWPESVAGAREAYRRAADLEPNQPWSWLEWARLERSLGDLDESARLARRALNAEPHAVRASLFLARVELDRGNARLAAEALESARASIALRRRSGLRPYEKELLAGPAWQFRELDEALR